jgi:MarR family transcriptional regulator, organic hydroperoxide resistance regulator
MGVEGDNTKMESLLRLDQQICFALYGAAHAFTRAYKPLLDPIGLTYPQYLVMMALWEKETSTVKALGEMLGLDSGTLSPLLKRLEHAGLITRKRGTVDEGRRPQERGREDHGGHWRRHRLRAGGTGAAAGSGECAEG